MVLDGSDLYLVAIHQHLLADGRLLSLVSSLPVDDRLMSAIAEGLGRAAMTPEVIGTPRSQQGSASGSRKANAQGTSPKTTPETPRRDPVQPTRIFGGVEPPAVNLADLRVRFASTFPVTRLGLRRSHDSPIEVTPAPRCSTASSSAAPSAASSPASSASASLSSASSSRSSRPSPSAWPLDSADHHHLRHRALPGHHHIDQGDFAHRIRVERDDQLAELSRSFNSMTGSLQRLLKEQKEKERLQNEISIAQEVQANLFPQKARDLPTLELHGVCRPARSVSGDYYDFLVFHERGPRRPAAAAT